ncbi:hypothetical protein B0J15DRAFT_495626 [Fusarium solani]|uniref:Uncharacterized protein n=1 Tax=Fusarium solani TaxID=169388 RepID=A0A9P9K8H7_FUSSL|nr:uncharacterized protein B0J15DRAFT_495626 [Fusarium solani]KAH7253302.1 hypothetical protein B0J15DRAFT_495626 [Fusarium solani]
MPPFAFTLRFSTDTAILVIACLLYLQHDWITLLANGIGEAAWTHRGQGVSRQASLIGATKGSGRSPDQAH